MGNRIMCLRAFLNAFILLFSIISGCSPNLNREMNVGNDHKENRKLAYSEKKDIQMEEKFEQLYSQWLKYIDKPQVKLSSSSEDYINCQPYREIIKLGRPALPFLIKKIEENLNGLSNQGEYLLWYAVREISGVNLKREGEYVGEQEIAKRYLDWWKSQ